MVGQARLGFGSEACRQVRRVSAAVYRGVPPGGGHNPRQRPPGLIIPGENNSPGQQGKLFVPGHQDSKQIEESKALQETRRRFKPPPGFLGKKEDTGDELSQELKELTVEQMLKKLETASEKWYVLARLIPLLFEQGLDAVVIEELSGLGKAEQSMMGVAADVRRSLISEGEVTEEVVEYYEIPGGHNLLYELRFLTGKGRGIGAEYIAQRGMDQQAAKDLARSIKEHIRRKGTRDGFSFGPEDCLAYKFYRNALETRETDIFLSFIQKGLDIAATPSAVAALEKLREKTLNAADEVQPDKTLASAKLMKDDVGFRPIAVAGYFDEVTATGLSSCTVVRQEGGFRVFRTDTGMANTWLVLPAWKVVQRAREPIALEFKDCNDSLPAAAASALGPTLEKRKKLKGGAIALVDRVYEEISRDSFYVIELEGGQLDIVRGRDDLADVCGEVLLLVRPPDQELVYSSLSELEI